jgi:AraC-like DNA-binding protein
MKTIAATTPSDPPIWVPLVEAQNHAFIITPCCGIFPFFWHYHRELELVWVRRGRGLRYTGLVVEPFKSGDLVLLGRGLPHVWGSAPDQQGDAKWTVIQFDPDRWGGMFWQMPELRELRNLLRHAEQGVQFHGRQVWQIGKLMEKAATLRPYSFEALAMFIEICRRLLKTPFRLLDSRPGSAMTARPDPRLQQVLTLVDKWSAEPLSQAGVAAQVKMNPAVFCRWFKKQTGRNFRRYLNEVLVARVCARLAGSEDSITSVAMECGFNNLSCFNRRFLEITGLTPRAFRGETRGICAQRPRSFIVRHGLYDTLRVAVLNDQPQPSSRR